MREFPTNKCLGWRPVKDGKAQDYVFMSYTDVQSELLGPVVACNSRSMLRIHTECIIERCLLSCRKGCGRICSHQGLRR